jgi:hypothetical protein
MPTLSRVASRRSARGDKTNILLSQSSPICAGAQAARQSRQLEEDHAACRCAALSPRGLHRRAHLFLSDFVAPGRAMRPRRFSLLVGGRIGLLCGGRGLWRSRALLFRATRLIRAVHRRHASIGRFRAGGRGGSGRALLSRTTRLIRAAGRRHLRRVRRVGRHAMLRGRCRGRVGGERRDEAHNQAQRR